MINIYYFQTFLTVRCTWPGGLLDVVVAVKDRTAVATSRCSKGTECCSSAQASTLSVTTDDVMKIAKI